MKSGFVFTILAVALILPLAGCESIYVGGSVGTLTDTGRRPSLLASP